VTCSVFEGYGRMRVQFGATPAARQVPRVRVLQLWQMPTLRIVLARNQELSAILAFLVISLMGPFSARPVPGAKLTAFLSPVKISLAS